ncbi:tetratricopeptide repeat protein [Glaciecola sp. XM2]|uniref:tetratricopeptide repeat protein n=1 Tax=Glaciecola sp. XM2 TaxID=1914931 RepID=UPI001BDF20C1|nr:tetratricopeptide repeat protein [Glaciecola sp. XM2]MBT1452227.1 tetratricopeptide repeat protein [Glaciecola sp. XM2]
MSENTVALNVENFKQVILEDSKHKIVIAYFWAPWDEASVQMMPVLENVCQQNPQTLKLATINCDEQPEIVGQFGVRSLPTTMLIKEGQPIDGFAGAQTPEQLSETLAKHLPSPASEALEQAVNAAQQGDMQTAFTYAKQAFDLDPDSIECRLLLADCAVETGQIETAKALVSEIKLVDQDARYQAIVGKIELAEKAAESPELKALQAELEKNPDDFDLKIKVAVQLQQAHKTEAALTLLFEVLSKDLNFADAKKITLDMINALPDGEPLKSKYRRKIYSLLY